jgi:two-component system nitrate/nitrite response regulator NarL
MQTLIIDDHPLFSAGLRLLLGATEGLGEIDCADSGFEAMQRAAAVAYDLVLLDWHLGREPSGVTLMLQLREVLPRARVVVVSGESHPDLVRSAIDAGAAGFVPKASSPEAMMQALATVARGGICLPEAALAAHAAGAAGAAGTAGAAHAAQRSAPRTAPVQDGSLPAAGVPLTEIGAAFPQLTLRHAQVLGHLVRGLPNKEIARSLGIAEGTVKQHANAIFRELGLQNRTEAVYLLARMGVRFR